MWDSVVIGGERKSGSAVKVFDIPGEHGISENGESYWIGDLYLDMGMTIFKHTEEGKALTGMIKNKVELHLILQYLNDLLLMQVERGKLKKAIDRALQNAYEQGSYDRRDLVLKALGLTQP